MHRPTVLPLKFRVMDVSCGDKHSLILGENGSIYSFGNNKYGQLGLGSNKLGQTLWKPKKIKVQNGLLLNDDNNESGNNNNNNNNKDNNSVIFVKIGANKESSYGITNEGYVYSWGNNHKKQLGFDLLENSNENIWSSPSLIETLTHENICDFSFGIYHCLFLTVDGRVYACGDNSYGQLGLISSLFLCFFLHALLFFLAFLCFFLAFFVFFFACFVVFFVWFVQTEFVESHIFTCEIAQCCM